MTSLPLFLISIICFSTIAFAGNLTPPAGSPTPTMFSLEQIYNSIAGSSYDSSGFSADVDGNVHEQLKYIASIISAGYTYGDEDPDYVLTTADGAGNYNATNLTPENVASGVNFGIGQTGTLEEGFEYGDDNPEYVAGTADGAGTLLANLTHGRNTANTFDVDDCNQGGYCYSPPATGRYATSWTPCNSDNNWCGLGSNGEGVAKAKDDITGLVWSMYCVQSCEVFGDGVYGGNSYNHATAFTNCSSGAHGKSGWRLPTQKELMQAYINGAYGNLQGQAQIAIRFWSATTVSQDTSSAWVVHLGTGNTTAESKTTTIPVRCVQLAP